MLPIVLFQLFVLFNIVQADSSLWSLIEDADFSFSQLRDGGDRETKEIVPTHFKCLGLPLGPDKYGLLIRPAETNLLDTIDSPLETKLSGDTVELPLVRFILTDEESRHQVVATTENDYTHALHGMFMVVVNKLMKKSATFKTLVCTYYRTILEPKKKSSNEPVIGPTLAAQRSVQSPNGYFMPDWLVAYPRQKTTSRDRRLAHPPAEVLSTVEFKMGGKEFDLISDLQDAFHASKGVAVAKLTGANVTYTLGVEKGKAGVYSYKPADVEAAITKNLPKGRKLSHYKDLKKAYTTMLDRILEAAATATWADTRLTLLAAGSRHFAAGPEAGYGAHKSARELPKDDKAATVGGVETRDYNEDESTGGVATRRDDSFDDATTPSDTDADTDTDTDADTDADTDTNPNPSPNSARASKLVGRQGGGAAKKVKPPPKKVIRPPKKVIPPPTAAECALVVAAARKGPTIGVIYTETYGRTIRAEADNSGVRVPGVAADDDAELEPELEPKARFIAHLLALTLDKLLYYTKKGSTPPQRSSKRPNVAAATGVAGRPTTEA